MNNSENKKSLEALPDEVLEKVSGGDGWIAGIPRSEYSKMSAYAKAFVERNCNGCSIENSDICLLWLDDKEIYTMFSGDPNAKCPNFRSI